MRHETITFSPPSGWKDAIKKLAHRAERNVSQFIVDRLKSDVEPELAKHRKRRRPLNQPKP